MKQAKWSWWALAITLLVLTACSRDVGECWLPSEDGQGAGAGGGPIVPAGAGGFGDVPPDEEASAPPPCDPDEAPTELGEVHCGKPAWGAQCVALCEANGVWCPGSVYHSVHKDQLGLLYKCCGCKGKQQCWYTFESGAICVWRPETGVLKCSVS